MPAPRIPRWIGWPLLGIWTYFVLTFFANRAIFHPTQYPDGPWEMQSHWKAEDVWLETSDGVKIHGWMIPSAGSAPLVTLYFHGNAGNLTHRVDHIEAIVEAGTPILIIDYPGYGKSDGSASEAGCYRAADAAYDYLTSHGYLPDQIVLYGESLGTAAAVDLASRKPSAGVVLEAPFPSARSVAARGAAGNRAAGRLGPRYRDQDHERQSTGLRLARNPRPGDRLRFGAGGLQACERAETILDRGRRTPQRYRCPREAGVCEEVAGVLRLTYNRSRWRFERPLASYVKRMGPRWRGAPSRKPGGRTCPA